MVRAATLQTGRVNARPECPPSLREARGLAALGPKSELQETGNAEVDLTDLDMAGHPALFAARHVPA